jgi:hypothetical protein
VDTGVSVCMHMFGAREIEDSLCDTCHECGLLFNPRKEQILSSAPNWEMYMTVAVDNIRKDKLHYSCMRCRSCNAGNGDKGDLRARKGAVAYLNQSPLSQMNLCWVALEELT